jgi:hypothetical protein
MKNNIACKTTKTISIINFQFFSKKKYENEQQKNCTIKLTLYKKIHKADSSSVYIYSYIYIYLNMYTYIYLYIIHIYRERKRQIFTTYNNKNICNNKKIIYTIVLYTYYLIIITILYRYKKKY